MSQDNNFEFTRPVARASKFFLKAGALIRTTRVNQDIAGVGFCEVAIN